jgi:hypothetical protein
MISITIAATSFRPRELPWKVLDGPRDIALGNRGQGHVKTGMQVGYGQPAAREVLAQCGRCRVAIRVAYPQVGARGWASRLGRRPADCRREPVIPAVAAAHNLVSIDADKLVGTQPVKHREKRARAQPDPAAREVPDPRHDPRAMLALGGERSHDQAGSLVHSTCRHTCFIYSLTE